jgi:hypothetical protein
MPTIVSNAITTSTITTIAFRLGKEAAYVSEMLSLNMASRSRGKNYADHDDDDDDDGTTNSCHTYFSLIDIDTRAVGVGIEQRAYG